MVSQTTIVHYIEYQFEKELNNVSNILEIKIPEDLYDNNSIFMEKLTSVCDKALDSINQAYIPDKPMPNIVNNIDMREPIGEVIDYCIECLQ